MSKFLHQLIGRIRKRFMPMTQEELQKAADRNVDRFFKWHHELNRQEGYEYQEFPHMLYGKGTKNDADIVQVTVKNPEERGKLGEGFFESADEARQAREQMLSGQQSSRREERDEQRDKRR
jgi:hypothetical protein